MIAEHRTRVARWGVIWLLLIGSVAGMMGTFAALTLVAEGWPDALLMTVIFVVMGVWMGGMALLMRRHAHPEAVYTLSPEALREEIRMRGGKPRVREAAWPGVTAFAAGRSMLTGLAYLRLRTTEGTWTLMPPQESENEAFIEFREAVVAQLRAYAVPARRPSRLAGLASRAAAAALALLLAGFPLYILSLPAAERPEMWGLRWLVLFGLSIPFISRVAGAGRLDG